MVYSALLTAQICGLAIIRRSFSKINRIWVDKTSLRWAKRILRLIGVKYEVYNPYGVEPIAGEATIIMCNHSSLYDIPLSLLAFPNHSVRMLAKKELSKIPIMGKGMKAAEYPFIDRKNRQQAITDLNYVRELLESGILMWIAPEGTRSKDGKVGPFKRGAFITAIQTRAKIIPFGIRGAHTILPANTFQFNLNQTAEIHIGKAIDASEYTLENKEELINRVHTAIKHLVEGENH
ncbi:lysophospholipid acyltransferase family protein [Legionella adelaidensis]